MSPEKGYELKVPLEANSTIFWASWSKTPRLRKQRKRPYINLPLGSGEDLQEPTCKRTFYRNISGQPWVSILKFRGVLGIFPSSKDAHLGQPHGDLAGALLEFGIPTATC